MSPERIEILGVPVDLVDMNAAIVAADTLVKGDTHGCCVLAVNPEKVLALRKDEWLLGFFKKATLLIPDGIGVVWAANSLAGTSIDRVAGADLMETLCSLAAKRGYKVYFYGATETVSEGAVEILKERYPGLPVVGRRNGFVADSDMNGLVDEINASGAQILFIAMGSPRQEKWMAAYGSRLQVKLIQGIGGTLDTITGHVKRAPASWQRLHLEWLYRLVREPKRIRRQILLPLFVHLVFRQKFFKR